MFLVSRLPPRLIETFIWLTHRLATHGKMVADYEKQCFKGFAFLRSARYIYAHQAYNI